MSERATSVVWLRDDLRLADNPALTAAVERGGPVVVLYLLDDVSTGIRALGAASRWWLHHSLAALAASLEAIGGRLRLERGSAASVIPSVIAETGATTVFWNRRYSAARHIDAELTATLRQAGVQAQSFHANLLFEPGTVLTGDGGPYRVFTPFWRACLESGEPRHPLPAPTAIEAADAGGDALADWQLLPTAPDWAPGLRETWTPGEAAAAHALDHFADSVLADYHLRDQPSQQVTSHLSPHLRFGEVSPFQVWHRLRDLTPDAATNAAKFLSELGWREFNWSTLFHFPELATSNFRPAFDAFPWKEPDPRELEAWQHGRTGIPLVDAGMRELWRTGYMHNRVRMVVASFLVKNLLVDWRVGEQWFWHTLVDADEANNPGNWQWVAGSGADAAPYFRVFNPELQASKFDPHGDYQRHWVPELGTADYPDPIVDLAMTRRRALSAYENSRSHSRGSAL